MKKFILPFVILLILSACSSNNSSEENNTVGLSDTRGEIETVYESLSPQAKALYFQQSNELSTPVSERIVELDELKIGCFGPKKVLAMSPADGNLGGQCCGALKDAEAYEIQLKVIQKFKQEHADGDLIPLDPYDLSVEEAQKLTIFDQNIALNQAQQEIYDQATAMSHHGGPCCCKCWKWYVMSGLGKKLIVDYDFSAKDLAEMWDISSSCGHDEDTDMHEHYEEDHQSESHHS